MADARSRSRLMDSRKPTAIRAPGSARITYHISVFPRESSCPAAKSSFGWTCTDRRSDVKTNFTSKGRSASNHTSPIFLSEVGYQGSRSGVPHTFSRNRVGSRLGALPLTNEAVDAIEPAFQFFHRRRVRNADVFGGSERFAWHQRHVRLR